MSTIATRLGYVYEASLGQAAREVANFIAVTDDSPPQPPLNFILDAAGATFWSVRQTVIVTTDYGMGPIQRLLDRHAKKIPVGWHVGLGEYVVPGIVPVRIIVALAAQNTVRLNPVARTYQSGDRLNLSSKLSRGFKNLTALAMAPTGGLNLYRFNQEKMASSWG